MKYRKLSIIIPVYNEEATIVELLDLVRKVELPIDREIICVDDGSKDRSAELIKSYIDKNRKKEKIVYYKKKNGGKGSAVRYGLKRATGDILVIQDADLEYDPQDHKRMIKHILNGKHKVVYGTRVNSGARGHLQNRHFTYNLHKFGNDFLSFMTSFLFFQKITDMETCYKMYTREVYSKMKLVSNDFQIEPEVTAKIVKNGYKIKEISINYYSRDFDEGKKITWRDGFKALLALFKWRIIN